MKRTATISLAAALMLCIGGCNDDFLGVSPVTTGRIFYNQIDPIHDYFSFIAASDNGAGARVVSGDTSLITSPPANGTIAYYHYETSTGLHKVIVADADGGNAHVVDSAGGVDSIMQQVALSPDGKKVAYVRAAGPRNGFAGEMVLKIVDIAGAGDTVAVDVRSMNPFDPFVDYIPQIAFSPDSRSVAVIVWGFLEYKIYVVGASGDFFYTIGDSVGLSMAWSPDGSMIAYTMGDPTFRVRVPLNGVDYSKSDATIISVVSVSGGMPRMMIEVPTGTELLDLAWSPTGTAIAYSQRVWNGMIPMASDIWIVRPDGSGAKALTASNLSPGGGNIPGVPINLYGFPQWSADGSRIVFSARAIDLTNRTATSSVKLLDLRTKEITTLVENALGGFWER